MAAATAAVPALVSKARRVSLDGGECGSSDIKPPILETCDKSLRSRCRREDLEFEITTQPSPEATPDSQRGTRRQTLCKKSATVSMQILSVAGGQRENKAQHLVRAERNLPSSFAQP